MKPTIPLVSVLTIALSSGCSVLPKVDFTPPEPVKVITEEVKIDIYQPPLPQEIKMENVDWFVITKNNYEESIGKVEKLLGGEFVVFALTPTGYEAMAYNLQEIRRFIRQQKEIILYYRKATEAADEADEWLEKNAEFQIDQEKAPSQEEFTKAITKKSGLSRFFNRNDDE
jgi:hypothetical protein